MKNKIIIIGIAGGSGSGKTRLVKNILNKVDNLKVDAIELDSYYKDLSHLTFSEREKNNFDHPKSVDFDLLQENLEDLINNKEISVPVYDYKTHTRKNKTNKLISKPILIIEGIFAVYNDQIRELMDLVVFIDIENNIRKKRRIERDMIQRKRTKESIIYQYENIVEPMQKKYIFPMKNKSDLILKENSEKSNEFNILTDYINKIIYKNEKD